MKICSWIGRLNIVNMSVLPKLIYKFSAAPFKIPTALFPDMSILFSHYFLLGHRNAVLFTYYLRADPKIRMENTNDLEYPKEF